MKKCSSFAAVVGAVILSGTISPLVGQALNLPSTYVNAQTPADQLQLNADNSFSLQEAGQAYHGTFVVTGNTLEITIADANTKTSMTIQGTNLTDPSGQTWALRAPSVPIASSGPALRNEDIIKLAKVGIDDATIIAKIGSSKCQFDTSTDALIQLKESGVTAAVLKAMVGAQTTIGAILTVPPSNNVRVEPAKLESPSTDAKGLGGNRVDFESDIEAGREVSLPVKINNAIPGYVFMVDGVVTLSKTTFGFRVTGGAVEFNVSPDKILQLTNRPEQSSRFLHVKVAVKNKKGTKEDKKDYYFYSAGATGPPSGLGSIDCGGCDDSMGVLYALLAKIRGGQ